jgi:hypothetical protein
MLKKTLLNPFFTALIILFSFNTISAQQTEIPIDNYLETILFDDTVNTLTKSIMNASRKQSIYAYNAANFSTPEFRPVLTPEERAELDALIPNQDKEYERAILTEFILSKMTDNRLKHAAFIGLQKKKFEILRQVATLGKR